MYHPGDNETAAIGMSCAHTFVEIGREYKVESPVFDDMIRLELYVFVQFVLFNIDDMSGCRNRAFEIGVSFKRNSMSDTDGSRIDFGVKLGPVIVVFLFICIHLRVLAPTIDKSDAP